MTIIPKPYQKEAVPKIRRALKKTGVALAVLASGLGKTITSALVWQGFGQGKGLFLAHVNGILDHAMGEYRKVYGDNAKFALYNGHSKDVEGAEAVFASFQTMGRHLEKFPPSYFAWMTVDETHHAQAKTYKPVIEYFLCPRLGITATPDRKDLLDIRHIFGDEVVDIPLEEALARNLLPKIEYHIVTDRGFDQETLQQLMKEAFEKGKRFSIREINRRLFIRARDERVAEIIEARKEKTVVFCSSIAHAKYFLKFLTSTEVYHSGQSSEKNQKVLDNLRSGKTQRVLAIDAFNEGIDIPDIGLVVFYRTTESETIFRQQLGRGLRPVKEKLVVLDFVGNAERIQMLKVMADKIRKFTPTDGHGGPCSGEREHIHVSGGSFDFFFADTVVDVIKLIERINLPFYPTWREASRATQELGIQTEYGYWKRYREDPRLPSAPREHYGDFPNWRIFFGKEVKNFYQTWQEASRATQLLKIFSLESYRAQHQRDPRLPANPDKRYIDFPNWPIFLGKPPKSFYPTWQEASTAARKLKISSFAKYRAAYHKDPRLPSNPNRVYHDFPSWIFFLGKKPRNFYESWEDVERACKQAGIKTWEEYKALRKVDNGLPPDPWHTYKDFPGFRKMLRGGNPAKRVRNAYTTWQEASEAVRRLGIETRNEYWQRYKADSRLHSAPDKRYSDFPGWRVFLGKEKEGRKSVKQKK